MTTTYGTIALSPAFPTRVEVLRRGASSPAASGFVASRQLRTAVSRQGGQAATRTWEVEFKDMGTTERDALLAAQAQGLGAVLPLLFTAPPPDEASPIPVRFLEDKITIEYVRSAKCFRARVPFEEVV